MAAYDSQVPSKKLGGKGSAHIAAFIKTRKHGLPRDDANGNLLDEAVTAHLDKADRAGPDPDSADDEQAVSAILRKKAEELEASRKKFAKYLSEEQKDYISRCPNTTEAVLAIVDSANFDWCSRSTSGSGVLAKLKGAFHKACTSLDQHAGLLSMLPKESEYVSVFYGALNSIVAASVMHQAMATGLPKIVDELNAIVSDVAKKIELYPEARQQLRRVLIELYTRIFDLLARLMKWYANNNHYWKLLKKDCYSDFEQDLQNIRGWVEIVNRGAWNSLVLELRHAHDHDLEMREEEQTIQEHFRQNMLNAADRFYVMQQNTAMQQAVQREQLVLLSSEAYQASFAELVVEKFARHFQIIGSNQTGVLTGMIDSASSSSDARDIGVQGSPSEVYSLATQSFLDAVGNNAQIMTPDLDNSASSNASPQSRDNVERYSRVLDDWYPEGSIQPAQLDTSSTGRPVLHESIAAQITHWTRREGSHVLCIQLPYNQNRASVGNEVASHVVSSAWQAKHPIISHFCSLPRRAAVCRSPQTVALTEMMISLIRQLVLQLPSVIPETAVTLDEARFASLDGTLRTWDRMLSLFVDLLALVTQSVLIVVYGLQQLDSVFTTPMVQELLTVIRERIDSQENSTTQTIKVLLVTEGQARAVVPWLRRGEHSISEGPQRLGHRLASV